MPDLVEQRRDELGRLALPRSGLVAEVGGVDPDQVAADLDDLGGRVVGRVGVAASCVMSPTVPQGPGAGPVLPAARDVR